MRTIKLFSFSLLLAAPLLVSAAGLVPDCEANGCTWDDFIKLIQTVLNYAIFALATPFTVIRFAQAGFIWMTSQGDTKAIGEAKKIFTNTGIGYAILISAFLIVKLLFQIFIKSSVPSLIG